MRWYPLIMKIGVIGRGSSMHFTEKMVKNFSLESAPGYFVSFRD